MRFCTAILLFITLCVSQGHSAIVRTLTNTKGVKVEAEIAGIWQGKVTFTLVSDKKSYTVPINSLVQADQDFLNQRSHLLMLPPPDSGFAEGAVIIAGAEGSVKVVSDSSGGSAARPAVVGESLGPNASIVTGKASSAILLFTNGTIATLTGTSRILLKAFLQSKFESNSGLVNDMKTEPSSSILRLDLSFGDLIVDVKKLTPKKSSFSIVSPIGVAGIRGTQFHLYARQGVDYLDVTAGSVDYGGGTLPLKAVGKGKRLVAKKAAGRNDPVLNPLKPIPKPKIREFNGYLRTARENDFVAKATFDDLRKAAFREPCELVWEFETRNVVTLS